MPKDVIKISHRHDKTSDHGAADGARHWVHHVQVEQLLCTLQAHHVPARCGIDEVASIETHRAPGFGVERRAQGGQAKRGSRGGGHGLDGAGSGPAKPSTGP